MKRTLTIKAGALLCVLVMLGSALSAWAAPDQSFGSFSARALIPENQVNKRNTYFDLRMEPGQEQQIQVRVTNSSGSDMVAEVEINPASTARGGLIVYSLNERHDESLRLSVEDVATLRQSQVTVPANGEALVDIDLAMPDEPFEGVILGGIVISSQNTGADITGGENGNNEVLLQNEVVYTIGLKLTESDEEVERDLNLLGITPGLTNYRTGVSVTLQNPVPVIMKEMQVDAYVYSNGNEDAVRSLSVTGAEMAPNSNCEFVIDWQNQPLDEGSYLLHMIVQHEDRMWEWSEQFTILSATAGTVNSGAVGLEETRSYTWLSVLLGLLALAAVIAAYLFGRRRGKEDDADPV